MGSPGLKKVFYKVYQLFCLYAALEKTIQSFLPNSSQTYQSKSKFEIQIFLKYCNLKLPLSQTIIPDEDAAIVAIFTTEISNKFAN